MGYFVRRIVGYIVFLSVLGFLSTLAVNADSASGGTLMTGTNGVVIGVLVLFASLMCSWIVRWMMRRRSKLARVHLR
jgi:uncharacterized membrane protein HdeD (DUF308 family)